MTETAEKTTVEYTPGQIKVLRINPDGAITIGREDCPHIASVRFSQNPKLSRAMGEANAARLVKCWNCHDELVAALRPFAHPDLSRIMGGNVEGDDSIVFRRNEARLTIGDFKRAAAALKGT